MTQKSVVTFYTIEEIDNYLKIGRSVERYCNKNDIVGTFFSTLQGINTTLSGNEESLKGLIVLLQEKYKLNISSQTWSKSKNNPFKRLKVKCRKNLLPLEGNFDPVNSRGKYLNYSDWNKLISDPDTLIIDVRNDYETEIGSFKNSIIPNIKNLTEFPNFVEKMLSTKKNKKIAMFCTGGIRCEIASSFMLSEGFTNVSQLEGGVLRYLNDVQDEKNLWQGECFVFDDRVTVDKNLKKGDYLQCFGCRRPLAKEDLESEFYKKGVSCHKCFHTSSDMDKERFAQRQLQIELAEKKGYTHMGANAKQSKR